MEKNSENKNGYLLEVNDLKTYFAVKRGLFRKTAGYIKAVDGVTFRIRRGESLGLVGESGCGKTTTGRTIARLVPATEGEVIYNGMDVLNASAKQLLQVRRDISLIFQDPFGSLNPRMTIANIVGESLKVHKNVTGAELAKRVKGLLEKVGLPSDSINRYPHEFSGGQRQRIGIARALALEPKLVICDEPVSALDVSIQSQILNLLKDLQQEFGLTYLFIAHDLAVVAFFCDVVAVMYLGKIVEQADAKELYQNPMHPYTKVLMSAIPDTDVSGGPRRKIRKGEVPSALNPPSGCPFHPRCPLADGQCSEQMASLEKKDGEHFLACWKCG